MSRKRLFVALTTIIALGLATAFAYRHDAWAPVSPSYAVSANSSATAASPTLALPDFSALVNQVGPAVVNISTVERTQVSAPDFELNPDDPFFEFFRQFKFPAPQFMPQKGVGSGFIVGSDGYILTNAHVVRDANEVTVKLTDGREFKAKVIGTDSRTDVALLKIDAHDLPTVKIGDSSEAKVGQWVAAIGAPFGFENSVTAGIISAKSRSLPDESYVPFIQTDVPINPGNSGGPLFNLKGEVIGINSQIYTRSGGYMGLSFAIPIEVAMKVKSDLQKYGKVTRGWLGVAVQPVSQELADSFKLKNVSGALVSSVEPDSPAAKAGVLPGDVILEVNDQSIEQPADLVRVIGDAQPGRAVTLQIWRAGAMRELQAVVKELASEKVASLTQGGHPALGLSVRPLTGEERHNLGINAGLIVEDVSGKAARAGIRVGDVILAINNEDIKSVEQLRRSVEQAHGNVALLIQRNDSRIYVPINLG